MKKIDLTGLERVNPRSLKFLVSNLNILISKHLWAKILFALSMGLILGFFLNVDRGYFEIETIRSWTKWLALPGDLFLKIVQMVVVPLVFSSIIKGVAGGQSLEQLKQLGVKTGVYFVFTTIVAIALGVGVSKLIHPGKYLDISSFNLETKLSDAHPSEVSLMKDKEVSQLLLDFLPNNPLLALSSSNMIQVVIFAIIFGAALVSLKSNESAPLLDFLGALQSVCMKIVSWAMLLAPIAVFGLTVKMASTMGKDLLLGMGSYVLTVLCGLIVLGLFYLCLIMFLAKKNVITFLKEIRENLLLAFSTSSSATVMPLSIKTATEKLKIRPSTSEFVIPLGATINMDGTAIYQMIATFFLANTYQIDLTMGEIFLVGISALGASIGSPGTPGVGIVILASILTSVGIPLEGTALIISVDRILDMSRTTLNVMGDLTAVSVLDRFVSSPKSYHEEINQEKAMEKQRTQKTQETIVK